MNLLGGWRQDVIGGGGSSGGGGSGVLVSKTSMDDNSGGPARVRVRYDAHLRSLSLWDRENLRNLLSRMLLSTLYSHIL